MSDLHSALNRRINIDDYLVWSTAVSVLMWVPLTGYSFQSGYVFVIANTLLLLALNRLSIHRNHIIALCILSVFSLFGAHQSGTPIQAPISQIIGISLLSTYYLCALTTFGLSSRSWMEVYLRVAFALAIYGLLTWPIVTVLTGDARLRAMFSEPSYFVYVTLPAVGYCVNRFLQERRYGTESVIFIISYVLADSALGFLGLMLIAAISLLPRLKGWQIILAGIISPLPVAALYFASANFRIRAHDTAVALINQDLTGATNSTFALLSNAYVTSQSLLAHPWTGIGAGGYAFAYDKYIGDIKGFGLSDVMSLELNRQDANSMFLRVGAEFGIPGLILLFGFLFICARVKGSPYLQIRNAILPYLLIRMGRGGHYFTVELYFFIGIYLLNFLEYRRNRALSLRPNF